MCYAWLDLVMYPLYADLSGTNIPALSTNISHVCQRQFMQVPMLHS